MHVREGRLQSLDAEAREPPQRGTREPIRLSLADDDTDRERVTKADVRQLAPALRMIAMLPVVTARRKRAYAILDLVTNVCSHATQGWE